MVLRLTPPVSAVSELALLLVGAEERRRRASSRIAVLAELVSDDAMVVEFARLGILTLALTRLFEIAPTSNSPGLRVLCADRLQDFTRRNVVIEGVGTAICDELERSGIAGMILKGPRMTERVHGDLGARVTSDLDLLVARENVDEAISVCERFGYDLSREVVREDHRLHVILHHKGGALPQIDLHWRLHWYEDQFAGGMLDRSARENGVRQPRASDEYAALLLFYARDGFVGLRLAADLSACRHTLIREADRVECTGLWLEHPALRPAWEAASTAASRVTGDDSIFADRTSRLARFGSRLANWDFVDSPDQAYADVLLIDGLLSPPKLRAHWARTAMVPAEHEIIAFYSIAPDAHLRLLLWRFIHPVKIALRFGLALLAVLGRGSYRPIPGA